MNFGLIYLSELSLISHCKRFIEFTPVSRQFQHHFRNEKCYLPSIGTQSLKGTEVNRVFPIYFQVKIYAPPTLLKYTKVACLPTKTSLQPPPTILKYTKLACFLIKIFPPPTLYSNILNWCVYLLKYPSSLPPTILKYTKLACLPTKISPPPTIYSNILNWRVYLLKVPQP